MRGGGNDLLVQRAFYLGVEPSQIQRFSLRSNVTPITKQF